MTRIAVSLAIAALLALALAACGDEVVDAGPVEMSDLDTEPDNEAGTSPEEDAAEDDADPEPQPDDDEAESDEPSDDAAAEQDTDGTDDEATEDATASIRLYYVAPGGETSGRAGPFLVSVQREIPATAGIAQATLRELVEGPSSQDASLIDEVFTSVPDDTLVLDVDVDGGVATIDLSREFESGGGSFSMRSRLAQVVYTATQFPTVDAVAFMLDGQPVTVFSGEGIEFDGPVSRADLVDLLPTVFVDAPAAGAEVSGGSLRMTGQAAVFEGTFAYRLETADGTELDEGFATTDHGTGWGSFDVTIDYDVDEAHEATLTVWERSAEDGAVQAERVTPLILLP